MSHYLFPALAVLLGFGLVFIWKPKNPQHLKIILSFSGGFLLAITFFNLIPEVFSSHNHEAGDNRHLGLLVMAGVLFQIFLEYFSKGAEHGHIHHSKLSQQFPWVLFISLFVHAFVEGFPVHKTHGMLLGIVVHKIPVAIVLATFLFQSKLSIKYIVLFMCLFSVATPLGTYMAANYAWATTYYVEISAIVIGIFLHISTTILFESNQNHKYNIAKMTAILVAVALAYLV